MHEASPPIRRIVIVGATSAIARQCAMRWAAQKPTRFELVGRDAGRLQAVADDLAVRSPQSLCQVHEVDLLDGQAIASCVARIMAQGQVDIALIAHGSLPDQSACQEDLALARQAIEVNAVSPVLWAEALAKAMATQPHGRLAIIGSVAGDRGRQSNYIYGSAKRLVEGYAQGLRHRLAGSGLKVTLIKPGPTLTPMTAHLAQQGVRLADASAVARHIVQAVERGQAVTYTPGKWRWIMGIIRRLPECVFNRMRI